MRNLFIAPHNDDETLFGAFTIQRLRGEIVVVIVFDGHVQQKRGLPVTAEERRHETDAAMEIFGCEDYTFLGFRDDEPVVIEDIATAFANLGVFDRVFAPAFEEKGHHQHNAVAAAAIAACQGEVVHYMTYTEAGKSVSRSPVEVREPEWIERKLRALACYKSQFNLDPRMGCWPHFLRSMEEYYL